MLETKYLVCLPRDEIPRWNYVFRDKKFR